MKVREKYLSNEISEKIDGFTFSGEKILKDLSQQIKKNGIKVKNSRMRPRVQREEKVIGVSLTFSAAFPFGGADFQVALDQRPKRK